MRLNIHILNDNVTELENALKQYFLERSRNNALIKKSRDLQNTIIKIQSSLITLFFKDTTDACQSEIYNEIQRMYEEYFPYLDSDSAEFFEGLKANFPSRVFELVVAHLSDQSGFILKNHNSPTTSKKGQKEAAPDLWCNDFFIECRANNSTFLHDWDKSLPDFEKYVGILKSLLAIRNSEKYEHPCLSIAQLWPYLSEQEIDGMAIQLGLPSKKVSEALSDWVLLSHHVRCYSENFLPKELQIQLHEINIKRTAARNIDNQFISKRIVESLVDKLQKKYFEKNHGIVAISTAFLIPGLQLSENETHTLVEYFNTNYESILFETISKKSGNKQRAILDGLNNLIAIILDTNWYNWFLPILQKHGSAHFTNPEQNNFFYLICDENHPDYLKVSQFRKTIQNYQTLSFIPEKLNQLSINDRENVEELI